MLFIIPWLLGYRETPSLGTDYVFLHHCLYTARRADTVCPRNHRDRRRLGRLRGGVAACRAWPPRRLLIEMKPLRMSPAHTTPLLAELVCSNSLRSDDPMTPAGLLKAGYAARTRLSLAAPMQRGFRRAMRWRSIGCCFRGFDGKGDAPSEHPASAASYVTSFRSDLASWRVDRWSMAGGTHAAAAVRGPAVFLRCDRADRRCGLDRS